MWKQYKNTIYEVNENGQVRNKKTGHIKSTRIKNNGYVILDLMINGERKTCHLHRIIAETFIPNPDNLPEVNHKDENKLNNCASNLEWCDHTYNNNYGNKNKLMLNTRTNKGYKNAPQAIQQLDKSGNVITTYSSMREAERQTGIANTHISEACRGIYETAGGFVWRKV